MAAHLAADLQPEETHLLPYIPQPGPACVGSLRGGRGGGAWSSAGGPRADAALLRPLTGGLVLMNVIILDKVCEYPGRWGPMDILLPPTLE